ncbi:anti-sigma factor antagonist BldG [Acidothermaceae bacterium B102]|nr:anti-sigma factor antagonist BldG [Acidothermaceae bacterium B102]
MAIEVGLRRTPGVVIVAPVGDLDIDSAPALRAALVEAIGGGSDRVVVDLAKVGFLDSTGIGQLAWLAADRGGGRTDVLVANAQPIVRNALRLMGLNAVLEVHAYGDPPPLPGVADTAR